MRKKTDFGALAFIFACFISSIPPAASHGVVNGIPSDAPLRQLQGLSLDPLDLFGGCCSPATLLVGGTILLEPEPFMASLRASGSGAHYCGGTLIHPRVVLTAAHCVENGFKPEVHIGRYHREGDDNSRFDSHQTVEVIPHENYDPVSVDYDIAMLVLDSKSSFQLQPLATSDSCFEEQAGCKVRLLGWGRDAYGNGQLASVIEDVHTTSVTRRECENLLGASTITDRMICAGELKDGKYDSCQGDSGGPMILNGEQVGIVSFGYGCGNAQSPGVYTSIPKLRSWIDAKLSSIGSRSQGPVHTPSPKPKPVVVSLPVPSPPSPAKPSSSSKGPCDCALDGISNGVTTSLYGCKKHFAEKGNNALFCMTVGGTQCPSAHPADSSSGAGWKLCN